MTSRDNDDARCDPASPIRRPAPVPSRAVSAMGSPLSADGQADPPRHVDYDRQVHSSSVPFVRVSTPEPSRARLTDKQRDTEFTHLMTSNGERDVLPTSRYSAPPTTDIVGGSPAPRRLGPGQRREPRRSLPTQPAAYDLLSPLVPRRVISRESSQSSLNFSGTPDFIPASAYLDDNDRRRRATGRPTVDHELAALTLDDQSRSRADEVFSSSATNTPLFSARRNDSVQSNDTDDASLRSSESLRNDATTGLPVTSPTTSAHNDRRVPATFVGAGNESCNGYNARTEALHSAAAVRYHLSSEHRQRSQSALADPIGPGTGTQRGPEVRLSAEGAYQRPAVTVMARNGSLDRRDTKGSMAPSRVTELTSPTSEPHAAPAISVSSSAGFLLLTSEFFRISVFCSPHTHFTSSLFSEFNLRTTTIFSARR